MPNPNNIKPYANLTHIAAQNGGPGRYIKRISSAGQLKGAGQAAGIILAATVIWHVVKHGPELWEGFKKHL